MYNCLDNEIINICRYEYNNFLNKANVVGIGYGYKYIKNIQTNEKVIQVFVEKKVPLNCLYEKDRIPSLYKNIKTDVIETGISRIKSLTERVRPVTGGYCIGPARTLKCGTYGGLVKDANGYYMLTNNHIITIDNVLPPGGLILQPCIRYGGMEPRDVVAEISRIIPISFINGTMRPRNYVDCALSKVSDLSLVSSEIKFIGVPKGVREATLSMNVQMTGQVSEIIKGTIISLHVTLIVQQLTGKRALYKDQILFTPPCMEGDSGALVLDDDNYVIGLNFAGNVTSSVANRISYVLDALQVEIVTDNNFRYN